MKVNLSIFKQIFSHLLLQITCIEWHRHCLFIHLYTEAVMQFGSPTQHIQEQLNHLAELFKLDAKFTFLPDQIQMSFKKPPAQLEKTVNISCSEYIRLGSINATSLICRYVATEEIPVSAGIAQLKKLLVAPPTYSHFTQCFTSFAISALTCVITLGGSIYDMCFAGLFGAVVAAFLFRKDYNKDFSLASST